MAKIPRSYVEFCMDYFLNRKEEKLNKKADF